MAPIAEFNTGEKVKIRGDVFIPYRPSNFQEVVLINPEGNTDIKNMNNKSGLVRVTPDFDGTVNSNTVAIQCSPTKPLRIETEDQHHSASYVTSTVHPSKWN